MGKQDWRWLTALWCHPIREVQVTVPHSLSSAGLRIWLHTNGPLPPQIEARVPWSALHQPNFCLYTVVFKALLNFILLSYCSGSKYTLDRIWKPLHERKWAQHCCLHCSRVAPPQLWGLSLLEGQRRKGNRLKLTHNILLPHRQEP